MFVVTAGKYFPGVEDLDNWHGKPLGKQSGPALEAVKALITDNGPHGLSPRPIKDDAPKVTFPKVQLCEPPKHTMGEKVRRRNFNTNCAREPLAFFLYTICCSTLFALLGCL